MGARGLAAVLLALVAVALPLAPGWAVACEVTQRAQMHFTMGGGVPIVPVAVNGIQARFVLDTGAERTVVTPAAVRRLGLARDEWVATSMRGVGGVERNRNALPRSLSLGGVALQRRTVARDSSLTVAQLAPVTPADPVDGLLGRDFLTAFDLALDFPARTVRLYDVTGCDGTFLPAGYRPIPVDMPANTALVLPVTLDGVPMRALLDTGANASLIAAPGMARLGLSRNGPAATPGSGRTVAGLGRATVTVSDRRIGRMQVGPATDTGVTLLMAPLHLVPIVDMLLGTDWLLGRRIWLSFATRQVFLAD